MADRGYGEGGRPPTRLVITVDTEPDDQWAPPVRGRLPQLTFENTRGLHRLSDHARRLGIAMTWMTSYATARDPLSAALLRECAAGGDEIAGHLHGWETPPFADFDSGARPFIGEYPAAMRLAKHETLVRAHEDAFGRRPLSYRAGRWGVDALELEHITALGYEIDSSIAPGIDFRDRCGLRALGPDFRRHLRAGPPRPARAGTLWQVPVSVTPIGPLGRGPAGATVARFAARRGPRSQAGVLAHRALDRSGLQRLVWVRPLRHPRDLLVAATRELVRQGAPILNVMFHSSEAFVGTSPLSRTRADTDRLYGDLAAIVRAAVEAGAEPCTLRDAVAAVAGTQSVPGCAAAHASPGTPDLRAPSR
jgi:hypothetical protein